MKKILCLLSCFFISGAFAFSAQTSIYDSRTDQEILSDSPYTQNQIKEYKELLKKGDRYSSNEEIFNAILCYFDALIKYPIIAREADTKLHDLMNMLYEKPGNREYSTLEEKAAGYKKIFEDAEKYLEANATYDISISSMRKIRDDSIEDNEVYLTKQPGIELDLSISYYHNQIRNIMFALSSMSVIDKIRYECPEYADLSFENESVFASRAKENNYIVDGVKLSQRSFYSPYLYPSYFPDNEFHFNFDVVDKNGNVIVDSEHVKRYSGTDFYYFKTLTPKAKSIWESQSTDFSIRLKSASVSYGNQNANVYPVDTARFKIVNAEEKPETLVHKYKLSYGDETWERVYPLSRMRYDLEKKLADEKYEKIPGLEIIRGLIFYENETLNIKETLYAVAVTEGVYKSYMNKNPPKKIQDSDMEDFSNAFNNGKIAGKPIGFNTSKRKFNFSATQIKYLNRYYDISIPTQTDILFYMTCPASEFDRNYFAQKKIDCDLEKELMVKIPGGSIEAEYRFSTKRVLEVKDFFIAKYPVPLNDIETLVNKKNSVFKNSTDRFEFAQAAAYCNILSEKYGYRPFYIVNGTTDVSKWSMVNYSESYRTQWRNVKFDWTSNGFRLPTLDELHYIHYSSLQADSEMYKIDGLAVDEGTPNSYGLYHAVSMDEFWCNNFRKEKRNIEDDPLNRLLTDVDNSWHSSSFLGGTNSKNITVPETAYVRICRSSPEEAQRLYKLAEIPPFPNPSRDEITALLAEVAVEGGTFNLSKIVSAYDCDLYENQKNNIQVDSFYMATTETTQMLYKLVMGETIGNATEETLPVSNMSFIDVAVFCNRLSALMGLEPCYSINGSTNFNDWNYVIHTSKYADITCNFNASGYRLPTNCEWEYACTGGKNRGRNKNDLGKNADKISWNYNNSANALHSVGTKLPNSLGLHDMYGNVSELCFDNEENIISIANNQKNPRPTTINSFKKIIARGASFKDQPQKNAFTICDDTYFISSDIGFKNVGFRVVRNMEN